MEKEIQLNPMSSTILSCIFLSLFSLHLYPTSYIAFCSLWFLLFSFQDLITSMKTWSSPSCQLIYCSSVFVLHFNLSHSPIMIKPSQQYLFLTATQYLLHIDFGSSLSVFYCTYFLSYLFCTFNLRLCFSWHAQLSFSYNTVMWQKDIFPLFYLYHFRILKFCSQFPRSY